MDKFSKVNAAQKFAAACDVKLAKAWTARSGWYYQDLLSAAMWGNWIRYEKEKRVKTPTVYLTGSSYQNCPVNTPTCLPLDASVYDNNIFWDAAVDPCRVTFKAAGLYLFGCRVQWTGVSSFIRGYIEARLNGSTPSAILQPIIYPGIQSIEELVTVQYFHSDDYIEIYATTNSGTQQARNLAFWCVAITPEGLLP
jgi:hypothetical protein